METKRSQWSVPVCVYMRAAGLEKVDIQGRGKDICGDTCRFHTGYMGYKWDTCRKKTSGVQRLKQGMYNTRSTLYIFLHITVLHQSGACHGGPPQTFLLASNLHLLHSTHGVREVPVVVQSKQQPRKHHLLLLGGQNGEQEMEPAIGDHWMSRGCRKVLL